MTAILYRTLLKSSRLILITPLLVAWLTPAVASVEHDAEAEFSHALELYEDTEYEAALEIFNRLADRFPEDSRYYHWMGKCYGRIAEQSNWLTAISYALRTRDLFRKAVDMDDTNTLALRDLMLYYQNAPAFLGGSEKKANEIRKRLDSLGISFN